MITTDLLHPDKAALYPLRQALIPAYIDYCQHVSRRSMAISIETATFVWHVCRQTDARVTADLGSGFTSYVLRRHGGDVTSVDDSPVWLDRTGAFLRKWRMPTTGLVDWDDWPAGPYDLIVHDFACGDLRNQSMWAAAERLAPGGVIVFDDAQHEGHRTEMQRVSDAFGLQLTDVRDFTVDAVLRFAAVAR
jgi:hypothetical protein